MPAQTQRVSRRSLLYGAAGMGAVGLAAATGAVTGLTRPDAAIPDAAAAQPDGGLARRGHQGPVTVYLRDAATGEMDVFAGTSQIRLHDPALATQLLRAIQ